MAGYLGAGAVAGGADGGGSEPPLEGRVKSTFGGLAIAF